MSERDKQNFVIKVWWMHGWPVGRIASWSGRTSGTVRGVVHRAFGDKSRQDMTLAERQKLLDQLKADRLDGGALRDEWFVAEPLQPGQRVSGLDDINEPVSAKKKQAEIKAERAAARQAQAEARERQAGGAARGEEAAAFEWLNGRRILADPASKVSRDSDGSGVRRFAAGQSLRHYMDGARVGGMNSVDWGGLSGGSGAGKTIAAHKLECIHALGAIKQGIRSVDGLGVELIEAVVDRDEFVFHRVPGGPERAEVYERIRKALDVVAVFEGMMTAASFADRWGQEIRIGEGMDWEDAAAVARQARYLVRDAKT